MWKQFGPKWGKGKAPESAVAYPACGYDHIDAYLSNDYDSVTGMSSRLSAYVAASILKAQSENGLYGHIAEIGAFEGRFLIPLLLALEPSERGVAVDTFDWPDAGLLHRLEDNLRRVGMEERVKILVADSGALNSTDLLVSSRGMKFRFIHVDGDHQLASLQNDLALALEVVEPWGVICLDDMLNPAYPRLGPVVDSALAARGNHMVFCVVDRESLTASTKYFISRREIAEIYGTYLREHYRQFVWPMRADFIEYSALILSNNPVLKRFLVGGGMKEVLPV